MHEKCFFTFIKSGFSALLSKKKKVNWDKPEARWTSLEYYQYSNQTKKNMDRERERERERERNSHDFNAAIWRKRLKIK